VSHRSFAFPGFRGEAAETLAVDDLAGVAARLADPASALATLHWGRNYLYRAQVETANGPLEVVVKQFRESGARERWRRRRRGSKGARSWRVARALAAAGVATPEPLLFVESVAPGGPSLYICRHLAGRVELRYFLRARNAGSEVAEFPALDAGALLDAVARLARRMHDAGFWHRDFSVGNLLIEPGATPQAIGEIALVDLNRCRMGRPVTLAERMRDLSRLALDREEDRTRLLAAYFAPEGAVPARAMLLYDAARRGFHGRHRFKKRWRGRAAALKEWLVGRGVHAHIPPPPAGAAARDKIVWDALSDQPHSHAGRLERARVRLADSRDHLASAAALAGAWPRIRKRYRALLAERDRGGFAWPGVGVALRPWPADPEALLAAVDALGVRQALVRLHPWQATHDDEAALAEALAARGLELTFALPQNRELVRDPVRWRAAVGELAERFVPFGRRFVLGQAINRSKWGVWSYGEYLELAASAAEILRARGKVELFGPGVIDFEAHATAAVVNRRHPTLHLDGLASLLYVDRRGAPENRQLGYDSADKVTLLRAIAETGRLVASGRQWITEVNWPLAEGPHSPAGRKVAVDEATQADYLARFYLLTLGTGLVERVFWWQLVARGYGLVDPGADGALRRRPAFHALAALARLLPSGTPVAAAPESVPGVRLRRFTLPGGTTLVAGWSLAGDARATLPFAPAAAFAQDGSPLPLPGGAEVALAPSVRWFRSASVS
jgi:hypothetical protein